MIETEQTLSQPRRSSDDAPGEAGGAPSEILETHETTIQPSSGWRAVNWAEMYEYRELLVFLIWRDISARYKQTILGGAWAIIQPLLMMIIFTFVSRYAKTPMPPNIPIPVAVFAALIPWTMFNQGLSGSSLSLVNSLNMVTKVYFPRLFLPFTAAAVFLVDGLLATMVYAVLLAFYGIVPHWTVVFLPLLFALTLIATLSIGVLLAGLTLFYRDFKHIVPFLVQILMYMTPIFYTPAMFPEKYRLVLAFINPMFGISDAFRSAILGTTMYWGPFLISSGVAIGLFIFSVHYFRRTERLFADHV